MTNFIGTINDDNKIESDVDFSEIMNNFHFTFVHQLSGLVNENALSITDNARVFKDSSTDAFVKNILGDAKIKLLFLDYTFHFINSMIKTKINDYLLTNDQVPLYADENIFFVFKGGNVMNYFMELYVKKIENIFKDIFLKNVSNKYQNPNILAYTNEDDKDNTSTYAAFFSRLKENFKISDVDYSIYIKASNYARYILIHGGIVQILGQTLSAISDNFDMLYDNTQINKMSIDYPETDDDVDDVDIYEHEYHKLKQLIVNEKFDSYVTHMKNNIIKSNDKDFDQELYDEISNSVIAASKFVNKIQQSIGSISKFTKIYQLITMIQYLQTVKYLNISNNKVNINSSNIDHIQYQLMTHLNNLIKKKYDNIHISNFYNEKNIQNIKSDIVNNLSSLQNKTKYEENNNGLVTNAKKYELVDVPNISNIEFSKRKDLIIKSNNDPINQYISAQSNNNRLHYITFNSIIKSVKKSNTSNFNLMRIKINIILTGDVMKINSVYKDTPIPSEFIDVSIPFYDDTTGNKFIDSIKNEPTKIFLKNSRINKNIVIQSYGLDDLTHDLLNVLFQQNFFVPWLDPKYNKRIFRLLFISILSAYVNDCAVDCEAKSMAIYKKVLDFSSTILNYMLKLSNGQKPIYPYAECGEFIDTTHNAADHIRAEIDDIIIKYKKILFVNLINIREEYHEMAVLLNFLIVYSRYVTLDKNIAFEFMNKNRHDYLYVPLEKDDFSEYSKKSNNKFIDMLKIIVNDGYKIYFIFENLMNLRKIYNQNNQFGGHCVNNISYRKYLKYKTKYLALKSYSKDFHNQ